jgi:hypothetical protein
MAKKARTNKPNDFQEQYHAEPEVIAQLDGDIEVWKVQVNSLNEQDKNARSQPPEVFNRLRDTMKRDNRLESMPLVSRSEDGVQIISGHHRIRAARMAGLTEIYVMADTRSLSRSAVVAKQLSHNALQGQDDISVLAQLFEEMDDIEDRLESGVDPRTIDLLNMEPVSIEPVGVDFTTKIVSLAFLPHKFTQFDDLLKRLNNDTDMVGVIDIETFENFRDTITRVGKIEDIRSVGSIMSRIVDITTESLDQMEREADGSKQETTEDSASSQEQ